MVRRWFRLGLRVGVLLGVTVAFVKLLQARRVNGEGEGETWTQSPDAWSPPRSKATPTPTAPAAPVTKAAPAAPMTKAAPVATPPPPAPAPIPPAPAAETPVAKAAPVAKAPKPAPPAKPPAAKAPAAKAPAAKVAKAPKVAKRAAKKAASTPRAEWDERVLGIRPSSADEDQLWVTPEDDRCPASHPLKAKLTSRIFHVPGMFAYDRTRPDRCYRDEAAAVADGFTKAKR